MVAGLEAVRRAVALLDDEPSVEAVRAAVVEMSALRDALLPAEVQADWRELARLFKSDPSSPVAGRSLAAMASWPRDRLSRLAEIVRRIHLTLEKLENERMEDEIRDNIRRHYL